MAHTIYMYELVVSIYNYNSLHCLNVFLLVCSICEEPGEGGRQRVVRLL